jgi:uncharacterized membrane protein YqjE
MCISGRIVVQSVMIYEGKTKNFEGLLLLAVAFLGNGLGLVTVILLSIFDSYLLTHCVPR